MSVFVVARIVARPDTVARTEAVLRALLEPTRREAGCVRYQLFANNANPTDFTFVEEWADDASIDAHMTTPHLGAAVAEVGDLLAVPPDIRRYRLLA